MDDPPQFDQRFMTPSLHMWAISKGAQQRYNVKCHHSLSGFKDRRRQRWRLNSFFAPINTTEAVYLYQKVEFVVLLLQDELLFSSVGDLASCGDLLP